MIYSNFSAKQARLMMGKIKIDNEKYEDKIQEQYYLIALEAMHGKNKCIFVFQDKKYKPWEDAAKEDLIENGFHFKLIGETKKVLYVCWSYQIKA